MESQIRPMKVEKRCYMKNNLRPLPTTTHLYKCQNYFFHILKWFQINRVLDRLIDKQFKEIINEVMAFKMHYITCLLEEVRLSLLFIAKISTQK